MGIIHPLDSALSQNNKVVVLNYRVSEGANSEQSLGAGDIERIKHAVRTANMQLILLLAGKDPQNYFGLEMVFAFGDSSVGKDFEKIYHLLLLDQLDRTLDVYGMVGGTSGTFDIAAFMGFNCFNLHTYCTTQDLLSAQEYRILLQNAFMTIVSRHQIDLLNTWLHQGYVMASLPGNRQIVPPKKSKNHKDRHPFTCFDIEDVGSCTKMPFHPHQELIARLLREYFVQE
jgi:hypothetical protein